MEALTQQGENLNKLAGIVNSVDALVALMETHVSEASAVAGGVPMEALREPAEATKAAMLQLKQGMRSVVGGLQVARASEEKPSETHGGQPEVVPEASLTIPGSFQPESAAGDKDGKDVLGGEDGKDVIRVTNTDGKITEPGMDAETPDGVGNGHSHDAEEPEAEDRMISKVSTGISDEPKNWLFYPSWTGKLSWDLFVMLIVVCDAMVLPFQLSFKHGQPQDTFDVFWFWITLSVFSADLVATFNTALQSEEPNGTGECSFNINRWEIARIYLRSWFMIDFVSTFPWSKFAEMFSNGDDGGALTHVTKLLKMLKFARIIRLMKMLRAKKIKDIWERVEVAIGSIVIVQSMMLLRILMIVVAICHWFACIFWIIGSPSSLITELLPASVQDRFLQLPHWTTIKRSYGPDLDDWTWKERPLTERYIFCFYWTLGVMRTMPAEVTPVNLVERIFVLIFMFFALSAFAISVASLTQAYFKINERSRSFGDEMFFIRMHLSKLKMDPQSQRRIKDYLAHLFERRRILAKEANLLDKMPEMLKKEVHSAKIMLQLRKLTVFPDLGKSTIKRLCESSETFDLMPEQTICVAGELSMATWIICKGVVCASDRSGELLMLEEPLEVIDEECLFTEVKSVSEITVRTLTCCEIVKIDKKSFLGGAWAGVSGSITPLRKSHSAARKGKGGGPQKIEVCEATGSSEDENGAASAAAAALSA